MNISHGRLLHLEDRSKALTELTVACRLWLDSPNNRQARARVRDLCKVNHDGTQIEMPIERDCGCPHGAEDKCVDILCPRK